MKLEVQNAVSETAPKIKYIIRVEFMEGDADGVRFKDIAIPSQQYLLDSGYTAEVNNLLSALDDVITLDSKGRGGYECLSEMINEHYSGSAILAFVKLQDYDLEELNEDQAALTLFPELMFDIPFAHGWYTSFKNYTVTYFNPIGIEFNVSVKHRNLLNLMITV